VVVTYGTETAISKETPNIILIYEFMIKKITIPKKEIEQDKNRICLIISSSFFSSEKIYKSKAVINVVSRKVFPVVS
jgi:hypothetical protein